MEDENIQTGTAPENAGSVEETQKTEPTGQSEPTSEKTYTQKEVDELLKNRLTQEQVNEIIEKRLAREKVKTPQSASGNNNNELVKVKGEVQNLQLKLAEYEKKVALAKYRIDEQYQDYVNYKVLHNVSKDKDYATALEEFFKDEANKRYLEGSDTQRPTPRPKNANSLENEKAADNNLRSMFGLGKK